MWCACCGRILIQVSCLSFFLRYRFFRGVAVIFYNVLILPTCGLWAVLLCVSVRPTDLPRFILAAPRGDTPLPLAESVGAGAIFVLLFVAACAVTGVYVEESFL